MKLPVTIHQARLGPVEFEVIRPARPLVHAVLADHDRHLDAHLGQDAARRIGALWTLAASSGGLCRGPAGAEWWHIFHAHHSELRTAGSSPSGRTLAVATSSDITLWTRPGLDV